LGSEIRIETFHTMVDCEVRKSEIYKETGERARCLLSSQRIKGERIKWK